MNDIVAAHPARKFHVILDNFNTHKPKNDLWLKRHPSVGAGGARKTSDAFWLGRMAGQRQQSRHEEAHPEVDGTQVTVT